MNLKHFFYLIILLLSSSIYAKDGNKNHNLIISVDGEVLAGNSISGLKIEFINNYGKKQEISVNYSPGKLVIEEKDELLISNIEIKDLILIFNRSEFCKDKIKTKRFEINLNYSIICNPYIVLNIYTMKKNKKIFYPLEGKDYTFEYYVPNSPSMIRPTKKDRNCKC